MKKKKNKASRKRSVVILSLLMALILVAGFFTFGNFWYGGKDEDDKIYHYVGVIGAIKLGIDLKGGVYVVMQPKVTADNQEEVMQNLRDSLNSDNGILAILQNRLTSKGYTEATVVQQTDLSGNISIRIEIPDVDDPEEVFDIIGSQAKLEFIGPDDGGDYAGKVIITGENIVSAYPTRDDSGNWAVGLKLDTEGAEAFSAATGSLTGKSISIYLDGEVISSPTVNQQITGGNAIITGMSDQQDAIDTAMLLQSGSLPVEFETIQPNTISATLGQDAINAGLLAGVIGLIAVMLFMGIYYRGLGIVADIGLLIYVLLLLFLMSQLPWVQLTLPGIAGVLLSIGMAVDANVIIFERIKDEYKSGITFRGSVQAGFKRATAAIVDANITTLIASIVLWLLGTGPVQGFAITLFLGIIISMFTALVVCRLLLKLFLPLNDSSEKFYGLKREEAVNE